MYIIDILGRTSIVKNFKHVLTSIPFRKELRNQVKGEKLFIQEICLCHTKQDKIQLTFYVLHQGDWVQVLCVSQQYHFDLML